MRAFLRTAQALALLLGFYALVLGSLAVILGLDLALTAASGSRGGFALAEIWGVSLLLAYPLACGLFIRHGANSYRPSGVRVSRNEQPRLWRRVDHIATSMRVTAPTEIWLVDEVKASVWQSSWLLGLIPGRRRMVLGLPLLSGLTTAEFDAVVAHELGHFGHGDTRLGGVVARNWAGLQQILARYSGEEGGWGQWLGGLFAGYARFCLRTGRATARRQELAADAAAARIAGREAMISALRALEPLDRAHQRFQGEYAETGWALGLRPVADDVLPRFQAFLSSASWQQEHARLLSDPPQQKQSPYDSHPPVAERITQLQALSPSPAPSDTAVTSVDAEDVTSVDVDAKDSAFALLDQPVTVAGLAVSARPGADERQQVGWTELAAAAGRAELELEAAGLLTASKAVLRRTVDLPALLDAIDSGRWSEIVDWMPREGMSRTVDSTTYRSMNGAAASDCLYSLLLAVLVEQGRGRWSMDGESGRRLVLDEGLDPALAPALDAAVAADAPTTAPLRALMLLAEPRTV